MTLQRTPIQIDGMPPGWTVEHVYSRDDHEADLVAKHPTYAPCYAATGMGVSDVNRATIRREAWLRHPKIKTIFLDVDEVLVDWVGATLTLLGHNPDEVSARWASMDPRPWNLFDALGISAAEMWPAINEAGAEFWANLQPLPWMRELYETCSAFAPTVLLTSPSEHSSSHAGKVQWMQREFGSSFRDYLISSVKHRCAHPGALLIDDSPKNCEAFVEHGGHSILFPSVTNGMHDMPHHERVDYVRSALETFRR